MATEKEKKKTQLPKDAIFNAVGIFFHEDIPKYHIDGVACEYYEYQEHLQKALACTQTYVKSPLIKKRLKEMVEKRRKKQT